MLEDSIKAAARALSGAGQVMAFTGAGVSAESGVATFRGAGGLWEGQPVEQVATPEAFRRDPLRVWRFYEARRVQASTVRPNPAHETLARWQRRFPAFCLATQNVDGLHQAAGSREVLELHGGLWRVRCTACDRQREDRTVPLPELPPRCSACGAIERPDIVWFGEVLPTDILSAAAQAAAKAEVFVVVGTSAVVYPAAGLVEIAASAGATIIEVNPAASALAHLADIVLRGPAGELLPRIDATLEVS
ncbi:MAG: NAD-dependent deacylase [Thermoanaerobaculaceae bacterium]|nr:NAD-dependent deacylase [Thermoanaerobaculaceae bacterium]MDI9621034.1 NAD-dependent deacylase [Acidobacteriota bacterium]NLH11022.1 NAD-dependent deacylase [Holophagae bacterium]HPW55851.1 NAD-dependent deacylase [Thermoanaerobaculaceae bacterium]